VVLPVPAQARPETGCREEIASLRVVCSGVSIRISVQRVVDDFVDIEYFFSICENVFVQRSFDFF
jgi:hypothetical protein